MSLSFVRFVSRILIACMVVLPFQASAGLIGTDQVISAAQAVAARDKVVSLIERTDVARQLQAYGLTPENARARVNALSDFEVAKLAGQLDSMPAGANSTGLILLILVIVLVWWLFWK
jgi:uncharacterized protein DUF6627